MCYPVLVSHEVKLPSKSPKSAVLLVKLSRAGFAGLRLTVLLSLATYCSSSVRTMAAWYQAIDMAALRAINPTSSCVLNNGDVAFVTGYYTPGDRGGGWFVWRTNQPPATHDGGRYIAPNENSSCGRWVRLLNGETANVKMWGATGTNANGAGSSPCDTDAIQRAANACKDDWQWSKELLFPAGQYLLTNTILFHPYVHLRGESCGNTLIFIQSDKDVFRTTEANRVILGDNPANVFDHNLLVENMAIFGVTNGTEGAALQVCQPGEAGVIRNLVTGGGGYGIRCFGAGAPGLRLQNVTVSNAYVASVSLEGSYKGTNYGQGGTHNFTGLSAIHRRDDSDSTACFVLLSNVVAAVSIHDAKAEGQFGGGMICYKRSSGGVYDIMGTVSIHGGTFNNETTSADFVVLKTPSGSDRTASVFIDQVNLAGVRYLIRDELTGRTVDPHVLEATYNQQATCRQPIQYESMIAGGIAASNAPISRMIVGDTAIYELDPPTNGWYRVMAQQLSHLGGRLTISSYKESSEISVDVHPTLDNASQGALINVIRQSKDFVYGERPAVTEVRAGSYHWDVPAGNYAFVDIHVERPITSAYPFHMRRIRIAHPIDNQVFTPSGQVQLLAPTNAIPYPGNPCPPGCDGTTKYLLSCVTNSLIR